jgi:Xaa-Pro aminopeptidase
MSGLERINKIYSQMKRQGFDSLLVTLPANITYLTGYVSRDSWLLLSKDKTFYITDSRYVFEVKKYLHPAFTVKEIESSLFGTVTALVKALAIKRLAFEEKYLATYIYQKLSASLPGTTGLIPAQGIVESQREIKTPQEIETINKATQIAIKALRFIKKHIATGAKEVEIAGEIERFIRYNGAEGPSFEIIVASGPNSSFPHHKTSSRKIGRNEPVLIDMGVEYRGYKSDLTRVFFLGKINPLVRKVYDIVAQAQSLAIKSIKPAVRMNKVDMAARQHIARNGYGGFFSHSLGHGIGLEIHESPRISPKENRRIKKGMAFTVEPAVYIPGEFGIRIEDMVVVTKKGARVLSGTLNK